MKTKEINTFCNHAIKTIVILVLLAINFPLYGEEVYHGSVQGNFAVSPMGAATYTVPIELPPGVGGMQPQIAITYNSQSGMGLAGWGCNPTGYSVITRAPKDKFHDGEAKGMKYGKNDAFYLDGKRLILSPEMDEIEGMPDCIYNPEGDPYTTVKVMGTYTAASDNRSFEVRAPDGLITIYGNTPGSRQGFQINDTSRIAAWYVHTVSDTLNNVIEWHYSEDQHFVYPTHVTYGLCSVEFSYTTLGNAARPFRLKNVAGLMNKLLTEIRCKSGNTIVRQYFLTYDTTSDGTTVKFPRLTQIDVSDGNEQSLRPLHLGWTPMAGFGVTPYDKTLGYPQIGEITKTLERKFMCADTNGDGVDDIIEYCRAKTTNGEGRWVSFHESTFDTATNKWGHHSGYGIAVSAEIEDDFGKSENTFNIGDFNADGKADFVYGSYQYSSYDNSNRVLFYVRHGQEGYETEPTSLVSVIDQPLRASTQMPLYAIADIDNDGKSDIVFLERENYFGYRCYVASSPTGYSPFSIEYGQLHLRDSLRMPMSAPKNLFVEDFDGDGFRDLLIVCDEGYKLYWNQKATNPSLFPFYEEMGYPGMSIDYAKRIEIGDFNGDQLPDFVINEENDSRYFFALSRGDGTFDKMLAANINLFDQDTNLDDNRFTVLVNDVDHDGKSDLLIAKAVYEHHEFWPFYDHDEFKHTDIRTYCSTGNTLSSLTSFRSGNDDDAVPGHIFFGDFNGDGVSEMANYGANITLNTTNSSPVEVRFYQGVNSIENRKITSITDGLGNTVTINYASLTNPNVYTRENNATYPIVDVCGSLHVVNSIQTPTMATLNNNSQMTETYSYGGLKAHTTGRGVLGFRTLIASNDVAGTTISTVTGGWSANNRYTPTFMNKTVTLSDNSVSTTHTAMSYHAIPDSLNYFLSTDTVIVTDYDGNTVTTEYNYNFGKGVMTKQRTYPDGNPTQMYKETETANYVKRAGKWIPCTIYTRQKHKDDPSEFVLRKEITYNSYGLPTTVINNFGSSLPLTTAYTYDQSGNVLSETISGDGLNTITTHYEYDDLTHRFLKKKYTTPSSSVMEYTHDNWGNVLTETDKTNPSNPLTTTNNYDGFGKLSRTISPQGVITTVSYHWGNNDIFRYYVSEETEGKPWVIKSYDTKNRETEVSTLGFNGIPFNKYNCYDERGNLVLKEKLVWNEIIAKEWLEYDIRGRVSKDSLFTGSTSTYAYGNRQVTETRDGRSFQTKYDAWGNVKSVQDPICSVTYTYKSNGKPAIASTGDAAVRMSYDDSGNQVSLEDPDAGTTSYTYNAAGQVISQTDARGITTTRTIDELNRITSITTGNTVVNYTYGTSGNAKNRLTGMTTPTHGIFYTYDQYGQIVTETRNYGSTQYIFTHSYDRLGNHSRTVYPGNVTVDYGYDDFGFCDTMYVNGARVWYVDACEYFNNGNDLVITDSLGSGQNGLERKIRYDDYGNLSTIVMTRQNSNLHSMTFYKEQKTGNLSSRSGMLPNEVEVFTYDPLYRLVRYQDNGSHWDNVYQYTHDGNIHYKTGVGYYDYQPTSGIRPHAVKRVDNMSGRISTDDNYVTYNDLGKASQILEDHAGIRYDLVYGPDGERWESSLYKTNYQWPDTVRRYVGNMEIVTQGPSEVCRFYYLGHGVILRKVNNTVTPLYAFTDNLGSITRLYTGNGTEKFKAQYDPWGVQTVTKNDVNFARGYCGHEMLNWFQLINMNGRMYDPMLGRFLSPDNYVQLPYSSQSFNRYSYCLNNPLKYTDPSGQLFGIDDAVLAFAFYNMASSMMWAAYNGQSVLKAGGLSLLSSASTYGIGTYFGGAGKFGHELLRAGSHGLATGFISSLDGGSFVNGFITGSVSSGISSLAQGTHMTKEMMVFSATLAGGIASFASGGNFFIGAIQGFQIALLNHTIHDGGFTYTTDENGNIDVYTPDVVVIAPMLNIIKNIEGLSTFGSAGMAYFEHNNYSEVFNVWRGKNGKLYRGLKGQGPNRYTGPRSNAFEKAIKHQKLGKMLGYVSIANSSQKFLNSSINSGFTSETLGYGIDLVFDFVGTYGGLKGLAIDFIYQYVIKNYPLIRQYEEQKIIDSIDMMRKGDIPFGYTPYPYY